uniref:Uncharacterized protein n=1 Tax=Arundo donax TaxID=35708 RepID=A0A0A9DIM4_ARUDO
MSSPRMPDSIWATMFAPSRVSHSMFLRSSSTSRQMGFQMPVTSGVITSVLFTTLLFLRCLSEHLEAWQVLPAGDRSSNWWNSGRSFLLELCCSSVN